MADERPPWRKVLYAQQPYPDNHTDASFLAAASSSASTSRYAPTTLARESVVVSAQVSLVAIFCALFYLTYSEVVTVGTLVALELLLLLLGWCCYSLVFDLRVALAALELEGRRLALLVGWLLALSPMLATLTSTWSDDTICALTMLLFLVHLAGHDYRYASTYSNRFEGSVSLNAAFFASVLLAARLPSTRHAFALMALAVQTFVLMPAQWRLLRPLLKPAQRAYGTLLLVAIVSAVLLHLSRIVAAAYLAVVVTISVLCPLLLGRLSQYKEEICGPWDFILLLSDGVEASPRKRATRGGRVVEFSDRTKQS